MAKVEFDAIQTPESLHGNVYSNKISCFSMISSLSSRNLDNIEAILAFGKMI